MTDKVEWNPPAATTKEELANVLYFSASGLKTQVLASALLHTNPKLKERISAIADELNGLQQDVFGI
ncbi:hypothetical protein [Herbaspirillum sp. RV1423]|uniref:hypothetical protein n=1 Tax=Herbaspirillum sp. RV1423 TaxID=1443993 RepID=UPI0004B9E75D|nr:hypothetical protein [Herbaspirillum sp. RV1423]